MLVEMQSVNEVGSVYDRSESPELQYLLEVAFDHHCYHSASLPQNVSGQDFDDEVEVNSSSVSSTDSTNQEIDEFSTGAAGSSRADSIDKEINAFPVGVAGRPRRVASREIGLEGTNILLVLRL
nr:hypothetical protein Iba_chr03aCG4700 [Ipomoea batatas]